MFIISAFLLASIPAGAQHSADTTCGMNIISSTVVASYCSHYDASADILDLLILWRGRPGWFQSVAPTSASSGSRTFGGGQNSKVSERRTYGSTTVAYDADFQARTVTIDDRHISLAPVNAVFVDGVDQPGLRRISEHRIEPRLPLGDDPHLVLAQRSSEMLTFLQCEIPMPVPSGPGQRQVPVITVCEKMGR